MIDSRPRRFIHAMLACCVLGLVAPGGAMGQGTLPEGLSTTIELNADQTSQIQSFVNSNLEALKGTEAAQVSQAMARLRAPFGGPSLRDISVSFRRRYAEALKPAFEEMLSAANLASPTSDLPIRALSIAGELATDDPAGLLARSLGAARADVRYQAAYGLRRSFFMLAQSRSPLMRPEQVQGLITNLGDQLSKERDPLVIDALIRALQVAGEPDAQHTLVIKTLGDAMSANAKAATKPSADPAEALAMLRAASAMRELLSAPGTVTAPAAKSSAEMTGQLAAYASRAVKLKTFESGNAADVRSALADLATASQTTALLAYSKLQLGGSAPTLPALGEPLRKGTTADDAKFLLDVGGFINNLLAKPPFGLAAGSFAL